MRRFLLWPFGILYGSIASLIRKYAEIKGRKIPSAFTVVVGNLAIGGTGKTPLIIQLTEEFLRKGLSVAVLSRGYGRKTKGFYALHDNSVAAEVGEEPLEIYKQTKVPVYVCEDRLEGIKKMAAKVDILLLDDGFQHLPLKAHFTIVLDNAKMPFYKNSVLPAGSLREFPSVLKEANAIVFTKTQPSFNYTEGFTKAHQYTKHVFTSSYQTTHTGLDLSKNYVLISALANNKALDQALKTFHVIKHFAYLDHYSFTPKDHKAWSKLAIENNAEIITTGKDQSKINKEWLDERLSINVVRSKHHFEKDGFAALIQLILTGKQNAQL
ncbi:tetraacyldisaccharide 4'-kinase [Bacteroidia bacterium]|nr:tetraacyldisaccharide 4'-kinase [Bacteroidia bacterium]